MLRRGVCLADRTRPRSDRSARHRGARGCRDRGSRLGGSRTGHRTRLASARSGRPQANDPRSSVSPGMEARRSGDRMRSGRDRSRRSGRSDANRLNEGWLLRDFVEVVRPRRTRVVMRMANPRLVTKPWRGLSRGARGKSRHQEGEEAPEGWAFVSANRDSSRCGRRLPEDRSAMASDDDFETRIREGHRFALRSIKPICGYPCTRYVRIRVINRRLGFDGDQIIRTIRTGSPQHQRGFDEVVRHKPRVGRRPWYSQDRRPRLASTSARICRHR
jgi:hypothetical protein